MLMLHFRLHDNVIWFKPPFMVMVQASFHDSYGPRNISLNYYIKKIVCTHP